MEQEHVEEICAEEFSRIKKLYHPDDDISVFRTQKPPMHLMSYTSSQWNEDDEPRITQVCMNTNPYTPNFGYLEFLALHKEMWGEGIGKEMLQAAENVFARLGKMGVYSKEITNPEFFERQGYIVSPNANGFWQGVKMFHTPAILKYMSN